MCPTPLVYPSHRETDPARVLLGCPTAPLVVPCEQWHSAAQTLGLCWRDVEMWRLCIDAVAFEQCKGVAALTGALKALMGDGRGPSRSCGQGVPCFHNQCRSPCSMPEAKKPKVSDPAPATSDAEPATFVLPQRIGEAVLRPNMELIFSTLYVAVTGTMQSFRCVGTVHVPPLIAPPVALL